MSVGILLGALALCVVASAFFSGTETALTSLSDTSVHQLKERRNPQARRLEELRADLPRTLSTLLIGNTLFNIAAGSIGTALAIGVLGERWGVLAATAGTTLLLLLFGEVTPKTLASRRPEAFAVAVAPAVALLVTLSAPIARLLAGAASPLLRPFGAGVPGPRAVTEEDVRSVISLSHVRGGLEKEETEILQAVLDFGELPVRDAMVPLARMITLPVGATFAEVQAVCRTHRYSRFPVHSASPDDFVGTLHVKDLFDVTDAEEKAFDLARHLRPAVFVPELKRAGDLFREMRRRRFHMAIVVDELGSVTGLVTLEDLVEEMLGDIADEHDEPDASPVLDGASILVEGSYPLTAAERELGLVLPAEGAETVAGFLIQAFGRIPRAGARTFVGDVELVVERASPRAVERVRITRKPRSPGGGEERKAS